MKIDHQSKDEITDISFDSHQFFFFDQMFKNSTTKEEIINIDQDLIIPENKLISEIYQCCICLNLPLNPIKCSTTQKCMCKECRKDINQCPFHCISCELIELTLNEKNTINSLKCHCKNKNCDSILKIEDYKTHVKNCQFGILFTCLICNNYKGNKNECIEHSKNCGFKICKCKYCDKNFQQILLNEHEFICSENKIKCKICNSYFQRNTEHNLTDCLNNQINYYKNLNNNNLEKINKLQNQNYKQKEKNDNLNMEITLLKSNYRHLKKINKSHEKQLNLEEKKEKKYKKRKSKINENNFDLNIKIKNNIKKRKTKILKKIKEINKNNNNNNSSKINGKHIIFNVHYLRKKKGNK